MDLSLSTTPGNASVRSTVEHAGKTGWLGVHEPAHPEILLRSKGGNFLIRVVKTDQGEFYYPTGEAEGDLSKVLAEKQGFTIVAGSHRLLIPAQAVEQHYYRHDDGVHHLAVSAPNTAEVVSVVTKANGQLRWMKSKELYAMAQQRRLSPALLQTLCIEMMAGTGG